MQKISDLIQEDVEHFLYAGDQWISGVDFAKLSDQFSILLEQSKATEGETVIITDVGYAKMLASAMVLLEKGINVLVAGSDFCQEKVSFSKQFGQYCYDGNSIETNECENPPRLDDVSIMESYINETGDFDVQTISWTSLLDRCQSFHIYDLIDEIVAFGNFSGIDRLYILSIALQRSLPIRFLKDRLPENAGAKHSLMFANTVNIVASMPLPSHNVHTVILSGIIPTQNILSKANADIQWKYRLIGPGLYRDMILPISTEGVIIYSNKIPDDFRLEPENDIFKIYAKDEASPDGWSYTGYKAAPSVNGYHLLDNDRQDCFCTGEDRVFYTGLEKIMEKHKLVDIGSIVVRLYQERFYLDAYYMPTAYKLLVNDLQFYLLKFITKELPVRNIVRMSELPINSNGNLCREKLPIPHNKFKGDDFSDLINDEIAKRILRILEATVEHVDMKKSFAELGINSLMFVDLSVKFEDEFDITFEDEMLDVEYYDHVGELIRYIKNLIEKNH